MAPVIIRYSQTHIMQYVTDAIEYLESKQFTPRSNECNYGLNTWGSSSVIRYMEDNWVFIWFEPGSDIAVYVNRNGDMLKFDSRHDIENMDIIRLDVAPVMEIDSPSPKKARVEYLYIQPEYVAESIYNDYPSPKRVCVEESYFEDYDIETPTRITESICPGAPMLKRAYMTPPRPTNNSVCPGAPKKDNFGA